jgi:hypothetical protein
VSCGGAQAHPKAVLVFGGHEDSVHMLQQRLRSNGLEVLHLPHRTWYEQRWLDMPAGGRPTTGYVGKGWEMLSAAGVSAGAALPGLAITSLL